MIAYIDNMLITGESPDVVRDHVTVMGTMEQQSNEKRKKSMAAQRAKRLPLVASQYYQLPAPMPVLAGRQ